MNRVILIILFFCCLLGKAQGISQTDSLRYVRAYQCVLNDSINKGKSIGVSNQIIGSSYYLFSKEYNSNKSDSLDNIRYDLECTKEYIDLKKILYKKQDSTYYTMFFSRNYVDELFIEVRENSQVDFFGEIIYYLIVFDQDNKIIKIYRKQMFGL